MIDAVHALVFAAGAEATRAFFRVVLDLPYVDDGGGWLIFSAPPTELAVHPGPGWERAQGQHPLFLMCDDIEHTLEDLRAQGFGLAGPRGRGVRPLIRMRCPVPARSAYTSQHTRARSTSELRGCARSRNCAPSHSARGVSFP